MGSDVVGAGQDVQRAATQRAGVQSGVGQRTDANGNVGALLQQIDDQVIAVEFQQDLGVQGAKLGDVRHDGVQHKGRGSVDAQAPGGGALVRDQTLFQFIHLFQNQLGPLEEKLALFSQVHAPRGAVDQRGFKLGLQP